MSTAQALPQKPVVGLYPGLSRAEYERIAGANASMLEHFERSAAHARQQMLHPRKPTAAMELGTAFHCAVLEPERFSREYVATIKVDRRTNEGKKAWKEFEEAHPGATVMDADDFMTVQKMRDAVWRHPIAKQLLGGLGHNEVGVVFEHGPTGVLCKGLMDRIATFDNWTWIIDLKKTTDASRDEFRWSIKRYHYGAKAAFYLDGCSTVAPRQRRFLWIAVEDEPPYEVALYEPDEDALRAGRIKYEKWLRLYEEVVRTGVWPGYETQIVQLSETDTEWR